MQLPAKDGCTPDPSRIVLYSPDGLGVGHLSRTARIATLVRAALPDADIMVVCSSPAVGYQKMLKSIDYVKLPSVTDAWQEHFRLRNAGSEARLDELITLRSALLLCVVQQVRPDVFILDHNPLGLRGEALPSLQWVRKHIPRARNVLGLQDIVNDAELVRSQWKRQGIYDALNDLYDAILVYGDESVFDCRREYGLPVEIACKVQFVGYVAPDEVHQAPEQTRGDLGLTSNDRLVMVMAGGGGDGGIVLETYLRCLEQLPSEVYSLILTGPLMEHREQNRLKRCAHSAHVRVETYLDGVADYLAAADLCICMGGASSIADILAINVPALVIPRVRGSQEQVIRAERLQARGAVELLMPTILSPDTLAEYVRSILGRHRREPAPVAADGAARTAETIVSWLRETGSSREPANSSVSAAPSQ